jgi:hypothetical protein
VLDSEHQIEIGRLRQAHQTARAFRVGERVVAEVQGEFHDGGSFPDRAARSIAPSKRHHGTRRGHREPPFMAASRTDACSSDPTLRILGSGRTQR